MSKATKDSNYYPEVAPEAAYESAGSGRPVGTRVEISFDLAKARALGRNVVRCEIQGDKLVMVVEETGKTGPMFTSEYEKELRETLGPDRAYEILDAAARKIERQVFISLLSE